MKRRGPMVVLGGAVVALAMWAVAHQLRPAPQPIPAPPFDSAASLTFLALGRQGYDNAWSRHIAAAMERLAAQQPTHFVLLLGDNFYPKGVASVDDPQWVSKFERRYAGPHLRGTPFFAIPGNHDHEGNLQAELDYAAHRAGSGRFHMDGPWYCRDFGRVGDRVLARVVFLDTIEMQEGDPQPQLDFLRASFNEPGDPVWRIVAAHYSCRSITHHPYTQQRVLESLRPLVSELHVDLYLSANGRFQQALRVAGEPIHVSTNGGGDQLESDLADVNEPDTFVQARPGFARVTLDASRLTVELFDDTGGEPFTMAVNR